MKSGFMGLQQIFSHADFILTFTLPQGTLKVEHQLSKLLLNYGTVRITWAALRARRLKRDMSAQTWQVSWERSEKNLVNDLYDPSSYEFGATTFCCHSLGSRVLSVRFVKLKTAVNSQEQAFVCFLSIRSSHIELCLRTPTVQRIRLFMQTNCTCFIHPEYSDYLV